MSFLAILVTRASGKSVDYKVKSVRSVWLAACWIGVCVGLIYLPDCGLGFIKDDYGWIASSRLDGWNSLWTMFRTAPTQFYRPLVSLSFGLNTLAFGLHPLPYGLTNLALALATAAAVGVLVWRQGFRPGVALLAASVWILNFHGIGMAILWTSGRTSLLSTLFAVCAAIAFTEARPIACGIFTMLALMSKEEPLLLPAVFLVWLLIDRARGDAVKERRRVWAFAASALGAVLYLGIRWQTDAFTPYTAPDFYRYRLSMIPINTLHYADRSLTLTVSLLLLGAFFIQRERLQLNEQERAAIARGFAWLVGGFVLTIMIPVRSSLYVLLPSVGSVLILAALGSAEWRAITRPRLVLAALLLLPLAFLPVYWARDAELKREEVLSTRVLHAITTRLAESRA